MTAKTLFLLRHAKAMHPEEGQTDAARPLAERGHEDASKLGAWLSAEGEHIEHIYASSSVRTRETYADLVQHMAVSVSFDDGLYLASHGELLQCVQQLPEEESHVLLLGHNPGLHQLAASLATPESLQKVPDLMMHFPTTALVKLQLTCPTWEEVQWEEAEIAYFWTRHEVQRSN